MPSPKPCSDPFLHAPFFSCKINISYFRRLRVRCLVQLRLERSTFGRAAIRRHVFFQPIHQTQSIRGSRPFTQRGLYDWIYACILPPIRAPYHAPLRARRPGAAHLVPWLNNAKATLSGSPRPTTVPFCLRS